MAGWAGLAQPLKGWTRKVVECHHRSNLQTYTFAVLHNRTALRSIMPGPALLLWIQADHAGNLTARRICLSKEFRRYGRISTANRSNTHPFQAPIQSCLPLSPPQPPPPPPLLRLPLLLPTALFPVFLPFLG